MTGRKKHENFFLKSSRTGESQREGGRRFLLPNRVLIHEDAQVDPKPRFEITYSSRTHQGIVLSLVLRDF